VAVAVVAVAEEAVVGVARVEGADQPCAVLSRSPSLLPS